MTQTKPKTIPKVSKKYQKSVKEYKKKNSQWPEQNPKLSQKYQKSIKKVSKNIKKELQKYPKRIPYVSQK